MQLITVDDLAAYLGQELEGRYVQAVDAVEAANAVVAAEIGWNIDDGTVHTITVPVVDSLLRLGSVMVTAVESVTVDGVERRWRLVQGRVYLRMNPWEYRPDQWATVKVRCGWSGDALDVARGVAKRVAARRLLNPLGQTMYDNPGYSVSLPDMSGRILTPDEQRLLGRIGNTSAVWT